MPYFKAPDSRLHFLTDEDVANGWMRVLPEGSLQLTDDQAADELTQLAQQQNQN